MAAAVASGPKGRGGPREPRRAGALPAGLTVLLLLGAAALGPRWFDGRAALEWTRYHAAQPADARPLERGRQVGRWAARAAERLAPLPPAAAAVRLALQSGRELLDGQPAAALALCGELQPALARLAQDPWRSRPGAAAALAEVEALRAQAQARSAAPPGGQP